MNIKISEIEQVFKDVFDEEEGVVTSVDTVYEKPRNTDEFLKLVITIQGLTTEDVSIVHTKFIFKTDVEKRNIISDSFLYLYEINCIFHEVEFSSVVDLKQKIEDIIESNNFGEDLQIISDFIEAPSMFLNYYMRRADITDYSIFDVEYQPKFKTMPCDETTFDFKLNINNQYDMELSIKKFEAETDEDKDTYKYQFRFMDEITTIETDTLKNFHFFIGNNIAKILDKKLKNK
jgi:hypothetical protein